MNPNKRSRPLLRPFPDSNQIHWSSHCQETLNQANSFISHIRKPGRAEEHPASFWTMSVASAKTQGHLWNHICSFVLDTRTSSQPQPFGQCPWPHRQPLRLQIRWQRSPHLTPNMSWTAMFCNIFLPSLPLQFETSRSRWERRPLLPAHRAAHSSSATAPSKQFLTPCLLPFTEPCTGPSCETERTESCSGLQGMGTVVQASSAEDAVQVRIRSFSWRISTGLDM